MVRPGQHRQRMPMNKGNHKGGHYSSNRPSNNNNAAANQVCYSSVLNHDKAISRTYCV